jgi:hypothetical protein
MSEPIDTADHVLHKPTGETWAVACVRDGKLSWCGWPEGMAELRDCTLTKKASPDERTKLLAELAAMNSSDHRCRYAKDLLAATPTPTSSARGDAHD